MTNLAKRVIRTTDDLPAHHWMARQLPKGCSLRGYAEDRAVSELTKAVQDALDAAGLSRAEVADCLGTSRSYISQVLNGSANMTLKTLGALLWVSGRQVSGLATEDIGAPQQQKHSSTRVFKLRITSSTEEGNEAEAIVAEPHFKTA